MRGLLAIFCALFASTLWAEGRLIFEAQDATLNIATPSDEITATLTVAGAYSSADRHGIEGVALINGILKSKRIQSWGGILLIDEGKAEIYPTAAVEYDGELFDLTTSNRLYLFIELAKEKRLSVIQSHLLIDGGELDLNYIHNAPKFVRRILFTGADGLIGIWQSEKPETLYEATRQLQNSHQPQMAFNLDMGAYDYCRRLIDAEVENCGEPGAGFEALTNVIELNAQISSQ